jgi:hypothetical protein
VDLLKTLLAFVLVITVAVGGVYAATNRGLLPGGKFAKIVSTFNWLKQSPLGDVTAGPAGQVQMLSSRAEQTASQAGAVLGSHIQADEDRTPLTQKAFEYARYTYCHEAVVDYESRYGKPEPIVQ